jgi:hypothetical protein
MSNDTKIFVKGASVLSVYESGDNDYALRLHYENAAGGDYVETSNRLCSLTRDQLVGIGLSLIQCASFDGESDDAVQKALEDIQMAMLKDKLKDGK